MGNKLSKLMKITYSLMIFTTILLIGSLIYIHTQVEDSSSVYSGSLGFYNKNWKADTDDGTAVFNLPKKIIAESSELTIYKTVQPKAMGKYIYFSNERMSISIYADGEEIFSVNQDDYFNKTLSIKGQYAVRLKENSKPYTLKICFSNLKIGENKLPGIRIGNFYDVISTSIKNDFFTILNLGILFLFAIELLVVVIYNGKAIIKDKRVICLLVTIIITIIWGYNDSSLANLLSHSKNFSAYLSYLAFMIMPIPIELFVWYSLKKKRKPLLYLIDISIINVILQIILGCLHIVPLNKLLILTHLIIFTLICLIIKCSHDEVKELGTKISRYMFVDYLILAFITAVALFDYWFMGEDVYRATMLTGLSLFTMALAYSIFVVYSDSTIDKIYKEQEIEIYRKLSTVDTLTGLGNRRRFDEEIKKVYENTNVESDALLIMIDLNGLKYTNDSFGHAAGDELIKRAAYTIRESFSSVGSCFRIGGDEFTIIIPNIIKNVNINKLNKIFKECIDESNVASKVKLSIAKGESRLYTINGEKKSISDWKQEADIRMYRDKAITGKGISRSGTDADFKEIVNCLISVEEAKDTYTAYHSERVKALSINIARHLGLSEKTISIISDAAYLHDIGKIGVSDKILMKPGRLTEEEFNQMKQHPVIGAQILQNSKSMSEICGIVYHHHERYDGKGYPDGISGDEIPIGARIVAIADSIDAMCSKRVYKHSMTLDECKNEIIDNLGKMYDPAIGKIVVENWQDIEKIILAQPKSLNISE